MARSTGASRGRPAKPETQRKRRNLTFRVRDYLRADLERIAAEEGRSISEVIEHRLERSFIEDLILYGEHGPPHIRQAVQTIARVLSSLELLTGRKALGPDGDPWLHEQAWRAVNLWFAATRPPGRTRAPRKLPDDPYLKRPPDIPIEAIGEVVMARQQIAEQLGPANLEEIRALREALERASKGETK